jgi:hypothetical protein
VIGLFAALAVWQHRQMVRGLPLRVMCLNELDAKAQAGSGAFAVLGTGSMVPYIPAASKGADPLKTVCAYAVPNGFGYQQIKKGDLVIYRASWTPSLVIHQAAQRDSQGWVMSGLGNKESESFARVTEKDFVAIIGEVYVW